MGEKDGKSVGSRMGAGDRRAFFSAGTPIFRTGDSRDFAYIIETGEVHILHAEPSTGRDNATLRLGHGEIFGEMALIDTGPRTATACAATDTHVLVISRKILQDRVEDMDPLLGLLLSLLVERYRTARRVMPESLVALDATDIQEHSLRFWDLERQKRVALHELRMEEDLRRGLEKDEFLPFLQPIVSLPERTLVGFESLVRWNHPVHGMLLPHYFVPVAEKTGEIRLLDDKMLRRACEAVRSLSVQTGRSLFIGVNLSGTDIGRPDLVDRISAILQECETDPASIHLEITESALISDPDHAETTLSSLKDLGVRIALDDFGTGYSSLGYLHRFPIDTIKIDRSFVRRMETNVKSLDIVRAMIGLARNFRLGVVAEGIETEREALAIAGIGCDMGQGNLLGVPLAPDVLGDWLLERTHHTPLSREAR